MTVESNRVEMKLPNDPAALPAMSAAVVHLAQRAGLDDAGQQDLAAAAEEACRNTFRLLHGEGARLSVVVQDFPDRVEVTVEHTGEALPSAGLETFAGFGSADGDLSGLALLARVDRVLYNTEAGISRMTLVKYLASASAQP